MPGKKQVVDIGGYKVKLSNLDKVLFPATKIIKAELIKYYLDIAPWMMHFAKNRPLSMIRFPDGILAHQFYSKNAPEWKPDWMETHRLVGDDIDYIIPQGTHDLVWLANLASIENHVMNKRVSGSLKMDHIVFDFDPPDDFDYAELRDLTILIGDFLQQKGFVPFVKTSGSRGSHIYLPIVPTENFEQVIKEIKLLAREIVIHFPEQTTNAFRKLKRAGKILIDINRNYEAQTTILPFSTRAREGAPVSMPLFWDDFKLTSSSQDYNIYTAKNYIEEKGYAWKDFELKAFNMMTLLKVEKVEKERARGPKIAEPAWFENPSYEHMLAGVSHSLKEGEQLVYENKWDGIRVFIYAHMGSCKIISRSGREMTKLFPEIVSIVESNPKQSAVLDGELVVVGLAGRPDFSRIISRMHSKTLSNTQIKKNPVLFYCFDILRWKDDEVINLEWSRRRAFLKESLKGYTGFMLSEALKEGQLLFNAAKSLDLEGVMIKNIKAKYSPGARTDAWLKLKFRSEAVCAILGFTEGEGDRTSFFGSLHIAEILDDGLVYRGRVGTGFNSKQLKIYRSLFDKLLLGDKPIDAVVEEENKTTWFAKQFPVCSIQYARITKNGTFREPVFKKLEENIYEQE